MSIKLLVSCSDDVESIGIVEKVKACIDGFNQKLMAAFGSEFKINVVYWKDKAYPKITLPSKTIQGHLNDEFADQCDVNISIFWTKLGPGVVQEIEDKILQGKQVFLYFIDLTAAPLPGGYIISQLNKVNTFKEKHKNDAFFWVINDLSNFETTFISHLREWLICLIKEGLIHKVVNPVPVIENLRVMRKKKSKNSSGLSIGDCLKFGRYDWRILDIIDDKALIITNNIIGLRSYNERFTTVVWKDSSIRRYLNEIFFNSEFSKEEQQQIIESFIINSPNRTYNIDSGENTNDKIFLLSIDDAIKYFANSTDRIAEFDVDSVKSNHTISNERIEEILSYMGAKKQHSYWYWLRSPGNDTADAAYIATDGNIREHGHDVYYCAGIRPAMWINLLKKI